MKGPVICFITLFVAFGLFAVAQENQDTPSQSPLRRQKIGMMGHGKGMMVQSSMIDCTGCMMNRLLMGSSNFYLDVRKPLGLTDVQVDELQHIRLNFTKQTVDLQGELNIARLELQQLLESDAIRINDANRKISDTYDLEAELQIEKVKSMIKARNVLTPSQREQVKYLTRRDIDMMLPDMGGGQEKRR
jgi:Spy/CpxP family protein refolding chaperone